MSLPIPIESLLVHGETPETIPCWAAVINRAQADNAASLGVVIPGFSSAKPRGFAIALGPREYKCLVPVVCIRDMLLTGASGSIHHSAWLSFPPGVTGIYVKYANEPASGGYGTVIEHISIFGQHGMRDELGGHGVRMSAAATLRDCVVQGFDGHGVDVFSGDGSCNFWHLTRVAALLNGGCGFHVQGNDANAGSAIACSASNNGSWGFDDESFLGNTYLACHTEANNTRNVGAGAYRAGGGVSTTTLVGCYAEYGQDDAGTGTGSAIVHPAMAINCLIEANPGFMSLKPGEDGAALFGNGVTGTGAYHGAAVDWWKNVYATLGGNRMADPGAAIAVGVVGSSPAYVLQYNAWAATDGCPGFWDWNRGANNGGRAFGWSDFTALETRRASANPTLYPGVKTILPNGYLLGGTQASGSMAERVAIVAAPTCPTTGYWVHGDRVVNSRPSVGAPAEWVCVVGTVYDGDPREPNYVERTPARWAVSCRVEAMV